MRSSSLRFKIKFDHGEKIMTPQSILYEQVRFVARWVVTYRLTSAAIGFLDLRQYVVTAGCIWSFGLARSVFSESEYEVCLRQSLDDYCLVMVGQGIRKMTVIKGTELICRIVPGIYRIIDTHRGPSRALLTVNNSNLHKSSIRGGRSMVIFYSEFTKSHGAVLYMDQDSQDSLKKCISSLQ